MKKEVENQFDVAIHDVKYLIADIFEERKEHHKKLDIFMRKHDKKINKMIKKGLHLVEELYKLYEDIDGKKYNEK